MSITFQFLQGGAGLVLGFAGGVGAMLLRRETRRDALATALDLQRAYAAELRASLLAHRNQLLSYGAGTLPRIPNAPPARNAAGWTAAALDRLAAALAPPPNNPPITPPPGTAGDFLARHPDLAIGTMNKRARMAAIAAGEIPPAGHQAAA
ncbi:MAG: hypothetical protein B7Y35_05990 [Sphingomonadales bacterium 28-64-96]|nr:MAG: hypothetical protein B7Y35_05990 [Sphingomonadales bacterium 28-64-96]